MLRFIIYHHWFCCVCFFCSQFNFYMDKWSIVDNTHVESQMVPGTVCTTVGCFNFASVAGRCVGFDCISGRCEECQAKGDLKFHCRKCRSISTGGIVCVSTSPPTLLYYMLSIVDEKTARRYLRSEDGRSYTIVNSEELRISTYSRIYGTDTFGANKGISNVNPQKRLERQLSALSERYEDRVKFFVPKISVVEEYILNEVGGKKTECNIRLLI